MVWVGWGQGVSWGGSGVDVRVGFVYGMGLSSCVGIVHAVFGGVFGMEFELCVIGVLYRWVYERLRGGVGGCGGGGMRGMIFIAVTGAGHFNSQPLWCCGG